METLRNNQDLHLCGGGSKKTSSKRPSPVLRATNRVLYGNKTMQSFTGYGLINEHKQLVFSETGRYARDYCEIVQTQHPCCEQPDCRNTTLVYWVQTPGSPTVIKEVSNANL